jgi:transcriptional regulator
MYAPPHFREDRAAVLHDTMRRIGFATLVTQGPDGIEANHLPLLLDTEAGILRGHVARANPMWQQLQPGAQVLAIYLGPHAYISPNWYPTKAQTGKAVPTWNYLTVHARGTVTVMDDGDWLRAHVTALSDTHEAGRPEPWAVTDAPGAYIDSLLRAIVGIEIAITSLEGKWKLSQNRAADIEGVREGLRQDGQPALADLMKP